MRKQVLFLILSVSLSGCTMVPASLSSIEQTEKARKFLKKNNSMIVGRLVSKTPGYFFTLSATHQGTKHKYTIMTPAANQLFSKHKQDNRDGYFFSVVPPGDYKVDKIMFTDVAYSGHVETDMSFTVPQNSFVYLGTVAFSWQKKKNYLIVQKGNVQYSVQDERIEAFNRLWRRFPELKEEGFQEVVNLIAIAGAQVFYKSTPSSYDNKNFSEQLKDGLHYRPLTSESINSN